MDNADLRIRNVTYELLVELGRAPTREEASLAAGEDVGASWTRLDAEHAIALDGAGEIRMMNPFSGVPTAHRVNARGRWWYANCAWDAFGVFVALEADGRYETICPDCGEELVVELRDGEPSDASLVFHCVVPAAHWWDDIDYT